MEPLTTESIEENKQKILSLLNSVERENIDALITYLKESDFFVAPASTRYHLNFPGGLAQHSLNVCKSLKHLNKIYKINIPEESVIITSLLHDICKINLYIPTGNGYIFNSSQPPGHGSLSVERIKKYIDLTEKEEMMIRWHMNHYDKEFKNSESSVRGKHPEIYVMYFADHLSSEYLEK